MFRNTDELFLCRFDEKVINDLQKTNWWEWNDEKIVGYSDLFDDPIKFIEKYKEQLE